MKFILLLCLFLNVNLFAQLDKLYYTARTDYEAKNFEKAISNFTKVINKKENYKDVLNLRGLTYLYLQEFDSALHDFSRYIMYNPKSSDAYNNRGLAFGYLDMPDSARVNFDKAIELEPNFAQPYVNIAFIYINTQTPDSALIFFKKAIALDKNLPEPYFQIGKIYHSKKNYKEAKENFNLAAIKGYPKDECFLNIGNILFKEKKFKAAVTEYSKAIKVNPLKTEAINNRALSYDSLGNLELAEKDRNKLKEMNKPYIIDFTNVKNKRFYNADSSISIELPEVWIKEEFNDSVSVNLNLLTDSKNDSTKYFAKVVLSLQKNIYSRFNLKNVQDIIGFWKGSSFENTKNYKEYNVFYEKTKMHKGYQCLEFLTRFQLNPESPIIKQYEFVLFKDDVLFYGYFQCFDFQYQFFKSLYEKAMLTIDVKM